MKRIIFFIGGVIILAALFWVVDKKVLTGCSVFSNLRVTQRWGKEFVSGANVAAGCFPKFCESVVIRQVTPYRDIRG